MPQFTISNTAQPPTLGRRFDPDRVPFAVRFVGDDEPVTVTGD